MSNEKSPEGKAGTTEENRRNGSAQRAEKQATEHPPLLGKELHIIVP